MVLYLYSGFVLSGNVEYFYVVWKFVFSLNPVSTASCIDYWIPHPVPVISPEGYFSRISIITKKLYSFG